MKSSKKVAIIVLILGVGIFGYSQYASASQIGVVITNSQILEKNEKGATYDVELKFENPSLLVLTAGKTDFFVMADEKIIGQGQLEPFMLQPLSSTMAKGTFSTDTQKNSDDLPIVKLTGVTKYDIVFISLEVPFVYYPTEEQAREFIHQN